MSKLVDFLNTWPTEVVRMCSNWNVLGREREEDLQYEKNDEDEGKDAKILD